jgi:hypothetical protein
MKEQINNAIKWLKDQPVKGCITGSSLLDYFEGQDVDVFMYDEKSFTKLLFAMHHSSMFYITDPLEKWKFDKFIDEEYSNFKKLGLITIKFVYNTCIEVNIILKKNCTDIFSVLSSFDLDIICKGYDIQTKKYLDLTENLPDKKTTWNKWNIKYYSGELWSLTQILRQIERCFKYSQRGYNTDEVILKYIELIEVLENYENVFNSENFKERLDIVKSNIKIIKEICNIWLKTHVITDEQLDLLKQKIKEM